MKTAGNGSGADLQRRQPERRRFWCLDNGTGRESGADRRRSFSALIVDDNPAIRQWLRGILSRAYPSLSIDEAADGENALERVAIKRPDLVFMDVKLPGRNGLDITRTIKSENRATTVCIVTSYDLPEYRDAALGSGADCFFVKDAVAESDIFAIVDAMLAGFERH